MGVETRKILTADEYLAGVLASGGIPGSDYRLLTLTSGSTKWMLVVPTDTITEWAERRARTSRSKGSE